ncbi:MAG: hypothetical protein ACKO8W_11575, partial [Dolichospermum sp.]
MKYIIAPSLVAGRGLGWGNLVSFTSVSAVVSCQWLVVSGRQLFSVPCSLFSVLYSLFPVILIVM